MKIPKSYEGKWVGLHLARPVYMFEYGAHVKWRGQDGIAPKLMTKLAPTAPGEEAKNIPALSDMIMGALVKEVADDTISFVLYVPDADNKGYLLMRSTVPSALVLHISSVEEFGAEDMPEMVTKQRQPQPQSKIVI